MTDDLQPASEFFTQSEGTDLGQVAHVYTDYSYIVDEFSDSDWEFFMDPIFSTTPFSANPPNFKTIYEEFTAEQFELYCFFHADVFYELTDALLESTDSDVEAIEQLSEIGWDRDLLENTYRTIRSYDESDEADPLHREYAILDVNRIFLTRLDALGNMFGQFGHNTYWVEEPTVGEQFTTTTFIDDKEYVLLGRITEKVDTEYEAAYDFTVLQYDTELNTDEYTHWMIEYEDDEEMLLYPEDEEYIFLESSKAFDTRTETEDPTVQQKTSES
jgi:hypothetical protein